VELANYIHQLLFEHDCVVIPNFGGFVANYESSQINGVRHTFTPPNKKILFNKNLIVNDGLLCHHIAMADGCSYKQAVAKVNQLVSEFKSDLDAGKTIELAKVGSLVLDTHATIQFIQNTEENYLLDSFGLGSFQAIPIKRASTAKQITKKVKDRKLVVAAAVKEPTNYKAIASYAIAAMLLLAILIVPYKTGILGNVNYASLNPFSSVTEQHYQAKESTVTFDEVEEPTIDVYENILNTNQTVEVGFIKGLDKKIIVLADNTDVSLEAPKNYKYFIVAGCFKEKTNAENHVITLRAKGYNAVIIGQNKYGLYRVGYQGFYNKMEALEALLDIKIDDNQAAWMLSI
jgi:nucleoid DNA-binding protein